MKCLCFSDSHGDSAKIAAALRMHPDAEVIFYLGDGLSDIEWLMRPDKAWLAVQGNCDYSPALGTGFVKKTDSIRLLDKKIIFTHGDLYGVKYGEGGIIKMAIEHNADLVLFGHTHIPLEKYIPKEDGGFYIFNPGSIGRSFEGKSSYGIINITEGGILLSHGLI